MPNVEQDKAKKFAQRFLDDASAMILGPLAWLGNKFNLFEHLSVEPKSYSELASESKCDERYIKEWLHAMTCAEWIEYDQDIQKFFLPPEHVPFLVRGNSNPSFRGDIFNAIRIFNESTPKYVDCFQNGGGLKLNEIHPQIAQAVESFTGPSQKYIVPSLIEEFLPEIHEDLQKGIIVADVGCGVGHALISLAQKYPNSTFHGFEPHEPSYLRA